MEMQERLERFQAANRRAYDAFSRAAQQFADLQDKHGSVLWNSFMALSEEERDRLDPDWRESYAEWAEYRTGE